MSAQSLSVLNLPVIATADLTARRFVGPTGAPAAAGGNALGVPTYGVLNGQVASVTVLGTAVVEAGAAIAKGAAIEADAQARAITNTTGVKVARAQQAAAQAGDLIEVLLIQN